MAERGRRAGAGILGGIAVLAGLVALDGVEGVPRILLLGFALAHVTALATGILTGRTLPAGAARILGLLLMLVTISFGAVMLPGLLSRPEASVGVARAVPFVLALMLLRAARRRRRRDDGLLLLGAASLLGLASLATEARTFLPALLVGVSAAGGTAFLLLLGDERRAGASRRVEFDLAGRTLRRGGLRRGLEAFWLGNRLAVGFLLLMLVTFLAVPRATDEEEEVEEETAARPAGRLLPGPWSVDGPEDAPRARSRTGFRPDVVLGDIGRIKQDLRIALQVSVYRDRIPYRLPMDQAYWRGQVHARFDGRRWSAAEPGRTHSVAEATRRRDWIQLRPLPSRLEPFAERGAQELHYIEQEILVSAMPDTSALFALYRPWLLDIGSEERYVARPGDTFALDHPHRRRRGYQVVSLVPREGRMDPWVESLSAAEMALYTRMPPGHERLAKTARAVCGDGGIEERAAHLAGWLGGACRYTLDVPTLDPRRPVENFVFDLKEGHCELFASAYAVMLRAVGIPCRLVTGLRGYEYIDSDVNPIHLVRYSNAHAWVEAFVPGKGWVTLDATPPDRSAQPSAETAPAGPEISEPEPAAPEEPAEPWNDWLLHYDRSAQRKLVADARAMAASVGEEIDGRSVGIGLVVATALVGVLLAPGLLRRRRKGRGAHPKIRAAGPGGDAVRRAYLALLGLLAGRGLRREASETPRELASRAIRVLPEIETPIRRLTEIHQDAVYGVRPAEREDGRQAAALVGEIRAGLRRGVRDGGMSS